MATINIKIFQITGADYSYYAEAYENGVVIARKNGNSQTDVQGFIEDYVNKNFLNTKISDYNITTA